jgi:hypothetical protein
MNIDPQLAMDCALALGGFALGAIAGRRVAAEMRIAISAIQMRLSALEQKAAGLGASILPMQNGSSAAALMHAHAPAASVNVPPVPAAPHAAALEHHASAVEKLAAAIEKHAQAVDEHGAATVAAAVEMASHSALGTAAASSMQPHPAALSPVHPVGAAAAAISGIAPQG